LAFAQPDGCFSHGAMVDFQMKYIALIFLCLSSQGFAASTVVQIDYPYFVWNAQGGRIAYHKSPNASPNWWHDVVTGPNGQLTLKGSSNPISITGDSKSANALSKVIKASAPVDQTALKANIVKNLKALSAPGLALLIGPWAVSAGLEYLNGDWVRNTDGEEPPSTTYSDYVAYQNPYSGAFYATSGEAWVSVQAMYPSSFPQNCSGDANETLHYVGVTKIYAQQYGKLDPATGYCAWKKTVYFYACPVNYSWGGTSCIAPPAVLPASPSDFDVLLTHRDMTAAEVQMYTDAGYYLPVQGVHTEIGDLSSLSSDDLSYLTSKGYFQPSPGSLAWPSGSPVTDPVTGQKSQPMVQADPAPNGGVRLTPYKAPLNADGTPATDASGNPLPNQESQPDPCELDPSRVGCASLGDAEDAEIPTTEVELTTNWNEFAFSGSCPADRTFAFGNRSATISMEPICNAAESYIRPFMLLAASVAAYLIFVGGVKTS
jgi:hypothetical protein